ncbi:zinc finger BED domain-containing protein 5-like [Oratosquilla oratoria]|uniref:zinc finger BED domain-containing protein 5-like n=1 Tax=Oratosquilla oratoria TaxID=337810 RepID=UPI003F76A667
MDLWLKTGSFGQLPNNGDNNFAGKQENGISTSGLNHAKEVESVDKLDSDDPDQSNLDISISSVRSHEEVGDSAATETRKRRRKYNSDYIRYGFFWRGTPEAPRPLCLLCHKTLCNESLKPSILKRHLVKQHKESSRKPIEFFQEKCEKHKSHLKEGAPELIEPTVREHVTSESFRAALSIVKSGIGSSLVKPVAKKITKIVLEEKVKYEVENITLSSHTLKKRIAAMDENIKNQLVARLQQSKYFSLQLDEATVSGERTYLQCYVRYVFSGEVHNDFLFCRPLSKNATGETMFNVVDDFIIYNNLDWSQCVSICMDDAHAGTGRWRSLARHVQEIAPFAELTCCCFYHNELIKKSLPSYLITVLDEAARILNSIKERAPSSFVYGTLCDAMGGEHCKLPRHPEISWLLQGNILLRLFELRDEVQILFRKCDDLGDQVHSFQWLLKLAYLSDIINAVNQLKQALRGKGITVFQVQDQVKRTRAKLNMWHEYLDKGDFGPFPSCAEFLVTAEKELDDVAVKAFKDHVQSLCSELGEYFPEPNPCLEWIRNPFEDKKCIEMARNKLSSESFDSLTAMSADAELESLFWQSNLNSFWVKVQHKYPELAEVALRYLLPFPTAYSCEVGLSMLLSLDSETSNPLDLEPLMRLRLSDIEPEISKLVHQRGQCQS